MHRLTKSTPRVVLKDLPSKMSHPNSKCATRSHTHAHISRTRCIILYCAKTNETFSENSRDKIYRASCSTAAQNSSSVHHSVSEQVATKEDWLSRRVARNHFAEPSVQPAVQSSRGVQILNNAHILAHNKKKASSDVLWRVKMKSSHGNTPVRYRKRKEVYRKNLESRYEAKCGGFAKLDTKSLRACQCASLDLRTSSSVASNEHALRKKSLLGCSTSEPTA